MSRLVCVLALSLGVGSWVHALEPGRLYTQGSRENKRIALSFDDGPGPETPVLLDLLDHYQVKATFFMLGEAVTNRPSTVQDVVRRGHEVGSHTLSHRNYLQHYRTLAKGSAAGSAAANSAEAQAKRDLVADMKRTEALLAPMVGKPITLCRMPHGIDRPWVRAAAGEAGLVLVNWTYGADWESKTVDELRPGYLNAIRPGAILLFHDGGRNRSKSFRLAEAVIRSARQQGYDIVTVGELLGK